MELGHFQPQILMIVALILTAAVVAFICDILKRNNEQLREINIELKIRQEEGQKRSHVPSVRAAERTEGPPKIEKVEKIAPAAPPAPHRAAPQLTAPKQRTINSEKKRAVNSEALAAMERGAARAGSGGRPRSTPVLEPRAETIVVAQQEIEKPEIVKAAPVATSAKKDWGSLLSRNAQGIRAARPAAPAKPTGFRTGFHDGFVLNKLVQSHQPVSGLVVSIGVNASQESDGKLPEGVSKLVESLIGPSDFAAQSGDDEFLLIYPQEHGASAQRRLSQIAQQLWDFQLRNLGTCQILFSWGGVEVQSESIDEAIASASERMQETKRGRKLLTMESPVQSREAIKLRQAV